MQQKKFIVSSYYEPLFKIGTTKIIYKRKVHLEDEKWKKHSMKIKCQIIQQWNSQKIWIDSNYYPQILKEIGKIRFPQLQVLHFPRNNIESIESFHRIWMPKLNQLSFQSNDICQLTDLRKGHWPSLQFLSLQNNKIQQLPFLPAIFSKQLFIVYVQLEKSDFQQCFDLGVFAKAQINKNFILRLSSQKRIKSPVIAKVLKKKFSQVTFYSDL